MLKKLDTKWLQRVTQAQGHVCLLKRAYAGARIVEYIQNDGTPTTASLVIDAYLCGVWEQVNVPPLQVGSAADLAPLLASGQRLQHRLGEGQGTVGHADAAELADDVPGAYFIPEHTDTQMA